jgi:hypothetical protein
MEDADDEDMIPVKEYEIKREDTDDEDVIPVKKYKIHDQVLGVRTCRKVAKRTRPSFLPAAAAAAAAENPTLPPPLEEEDLTVAKRLGDKHQLVFPLQQMES